MHTDMTDYQSETIETIKSTFQLIANLTDEDLVIDVCQGALSEMAKAFSFENSPVQSREA